jgi:hypothetical protein
LFQILQVGFFRLELGSPLADFVVLLLHLKHAPETFAHIKALTIELSGAERVILAAVLPEGLLPAS